MEVPGSLRYTESHEWIADNGDGTVTVGITSVATESLGELVYVELPMPGAIYRKGTVCAVVESTKAAADVYAPVSGEVVKVNEALSATPNIVNASPYSDGWLFSLRVLDANEAGSLLNAHTYRVSSKAE